MHNFQMNPDIKFAISSHVAFYPITLPIITKSLIESGVDPNDIHFFIGGFTHNKQINTNPNIYEVNHNSMDFTGLISVLDFDLKADFWFLLHDTVYVGKSFYNKILSYDYNFDTISLTRNGKSMNMGAYKQSYLESIRNLLMGHKNQNYDLDSIHDTKRKAVSTEDCFIHIPKRNFYTANIRYEGPIDFYKNNVPRIIEHFDDIDLHKIKANWIAKPQYEINL